MRHNKRLKLLFRYAITAALSAPLAAIIALILFQKTSIQVAVVGLIFGWATPGILMTYVLENYLLFFSKNNHGFIVVISLIPWVIWGFSFFTKKEKWITFLGLFILLYTLYGALALVLLMMGGT
ncbi:MAG: hypothetical protein AB1589_28025 [Cyanobacteriota bacterium]